MKLSRGQRRRRKGKDRIRKRANFEKEVLQAKEKQKSLEENGLFSNLEGLAKSLPSSDKGENGKTKSMTSKQRHRVCTSEVSVMKKVILHPTFKSNPLSALKQHLLMSTTTRTEESSS